MGSLRRALVSVDRFLQSSAAIHSSFSVAEANSLVRAPESLCRPHSTVGYCRVYRFYSNNYTNLPSFNIDLSNEESKKHLYNRLVYRSKQMGFLELDLVLGKWVEEHINSMDENGIKALVHVLDLENPDLWKWITGQEQTPKALQINPVFTALRDKVMNNLNRHSSPETRAKPGQPWVRGWDDIKRARDSPITGNQ
ncbi:succinate dehydrogenase assembly factor 2, mitochondrial-like [Humulus lupulus]|uniref:succinate dehydrogenase assembly factor 2, mitochondrial-like n=1 Tax=Humulus lupulus TaxID=3486 RepID=UPI002B413195|nr:succinate dehydrogenase assembly factor 2, mitochondrial-like [Humulus lupulus]